MSSVATARYTITDLGTLPGGAHAMAQGVSAAGRVVGSAQTDLGFFHAFLYATDGFPFAGVALHGMIDLATLGGLTSIATAVNAAGHVAGNSETAAGTMRAFFYNIDNISYARYRGGILQELGTLGGPNSSVAALDDNDRAVGAADTAAGTTHAVLYTAGGLHDLGTLGGGNSGAAALNAMGWVVGGAETASGAAHAFLWQGAGPLLDLGTLGGANSSAAAINASGQVAGSAENGAGMSHAFLWMQGSMQDLGTLGGATSAANDLDDAGQVVGRSETAGGASHAFLYSGALLDLNNLVPAGTGWELVEATGINNAGQIAGTGVYQGQMRAFLLTPA